MNLRVWLSVASGLVLAGTHAAIFEFDLGPVDAAGAGLHPGNTVGSVSSRATGGELNTRNPLSAGITYNDETHTLSINIGWGTDYGFTDLQGSPLMLEVGGPTSVPRAESNTLYELYSFHPGFFGESTRDGTFRADVPLEIDPGSTSYTIEAQEGDLRAGLWYLNLRTGAYPSGEIRGQLIPVPEPQTYATFAALALFAFAIHHRRSRPRPHPTHS